MSVLFTDLVESTATTGDGIMAVFSGVGAALDAAVAMLERRLALADEAVAVARRVGDPATLAEVLDAGVFATWIPERSMNDWRGVKRPSVS